MAGTVFERAVDILDQGDACHLGLLIGTLYLVGRQMVAHRPRLFLWGLRIAALAFAAYAVTGCARFVPATAAEVWWIVFRGLLAGGMGLGIAWVSLPIVAVAYEATLGAAAERSRRAVERARMASGRPPPPSSLPPVPPAPDRKAEEEQRRLDAQRRVSLRFEAETFYHRHAASLKDTYPPEAFAAFLQKYMGDGDPPAVLEERLKKFQAFLLELASPGSRDSGARDPEALTRWYEAERERLLARPMEEKDRQTQLARLYTRYTELMDEAMKTVEPS